MRKRSLLLSFVCVVLVGACGGKDAAPTASPAAVASDIALPAGMTLVTDVTKVCMINDQVFPTTQIPVPVDGKTYFGCCPMCKDRLALEPSTRTALDPVTGEPVDKATAIIVQDGTGRVRYFASEDTLRRWRL